MNHRSFEDWLLNDQPLTPTEKRDLDTHIRTCKYCAALAETSLELRSVRMIPPKPGFTSRFQKCLAAQRIESPCSGNRRNKNRKPLVG